MRSRISEDHLLGHRVKATDFCIAPYQRITIPSINPTSWYHAHLPWHHHQRINYHDRKRHPFLVPRKPWYSLTSPSCTCSYCIRDKAYRILVLVTCYIILQQCLNHPLLPLAIFHHVWEKVTFLPAACCCGSSKVYRPWRQMDRYRWQSCQCTRWRRDCW